MPWLGVDIGTGGSRALIVDERGSVLAGVTAPHQDMSMPRPLWAEQDPYDWWNAARSAIRKVLSDAGVRGDQIKGVGLSGQMHGLTMLDENHQVIRPALIWCDQRSQLQVDWIHRTVGRDRVLEFTANPVVTGFTLPKLLWVREHEPQNWDRVKNILLPKDYVRFRLTGEFASDVSDASGTALFDVAHRRWSDDMASACGLDRSILPAAFESTELTGRISATAAVETGLSEGIPVVGGGGDQAASAVGNGIVESGIASCTLGTSGVVFAQMDSPEFDAAGRVHTFCHAVKGKWNVMGVTQGAGLSLQWFRRQLAPEKSYDELTSEAAGAEPGAQGLFWLPYLMGERTPHLDATARAAWVGLTAKHSRSDLIRSVIEGVAFSQKDGLGIIEAMAVPVNSIRLSGGGAKSSLWRQIMASVLNKRVTTTDTQEGSAYGAALLAMTGTGAYGTIEECCRVAVHEVDQVEPRMTDVHEYQGLYGRYKLIYPALKPLYAQY